MTSSPGPTPKTRNANSKAAVAEFKQTTFSVPIYSANWRSNSFVFGPVVIQPDCSTSTTLLISFSVISGGENGIFLTFMLVPPSYFKTAITVFTMIAISFFKLHFFK